jgi:RNA polymerase sigma-70 factor (ECF subfamily)
MSDTSNPSLAASTEEDILRLRPRIMAIARRSGVSREDAEDIAQEVLIDVLRLLSRPDTKSRTAPTLASYVHVVTKHHVIDYFRRRHHKPVAAQMDDSTDVGSPPVQEAQQLVAEALESLSPQERAILILSTQQGFTVSEIARMLGSSERHASRQLSSARRRFSARFTAAQEKER